MTCLRLVLYSRERNSDIAQGTNAGTAWQTDAAVVIDPLTKTLL